MKRALFLIAMAGYPAIAQTQTGSVLVSHHFIESAQGWQVAGDTGTVSPMFSASGGHPDGCITGTDEAIGETWYFRAPMSVLRQLPGCRQRHHQLQPQTIRIAGQPV